ncbi:MAG: NAD(P)/FAD-dependent oxidoreductase [Pyrinomonadaceae bacterium]
MQKTAIIVGAGPAGLTAAYELLDKTEIKPIIFEASGDIGGLSRTVNYKGNRIDIGGHRFFSKSDRVMQFWQNILPLEGARGGNNSAIDITYQNKKRSLDVPGDGPDPAETDKVMLICNRLSRIFFLRKFFNYPISLNFQTAHNLGLRRLTKIVASYGKTRLFPIKEEKSLEDFFINRFGGELYRTFFKDYTEKVWGVPCHEIDAEWGAQRIKGLSITKAILHAAKSLTAKNSSIAQKDTETSLIEKFMYPKYGPGQMWEEVARIVRERGGEIHQHHRAVGLKHDGGKVTGLDVMDEATGTVKAQVGDYFFSTMPVTELIRCFGETPSAEVSRVAQGLVYRDFMTVGLLLSKLKIKHGSKGNGNGNGKGHLVPDNWIYIQERDVKVGRLQVFNNWSPYMVKNPNTVWLGMEYFCNEGDELWSKPDAEFSRFAAGELAKIGIIEEQDVLDSVVIRVPKTYPAYFGAYNQFDVIREFVDGFENLFLIGRNGMHKYNNQDHSMLTAMTAVENIINGSASKENIWSVNTEQEYHESKQSEKIEPEIEIEAEPRRPLSQEAEAR